MKLLTWARPVFCATALRSVLPGPGPPRQLRADSAGCCWQGRCRRRGEPLQRSTRCTTVLRLRSSTIYRAMQGQSCFQLPARGFARAGRRRLSQRHPDRLRHVLWCHREWPDARPRTAAVRQRRRVRGAAWRHAAASAHWLSRQRPRLSLSFASPRSAPVCVCLCPPQGTWVYGKRHGNGSYEYHDGGKYDGEWVDDKVRREGYAERVLSCLPSSRTSH